MTTTIESAYRFTEDIVEHPPFTGFHAGLMDMVSWQIEVVDHYLSIERVGDGALFVLDVEFVMGQELDCGHVIGDGEETASKRVIVGDRRGVGVRDGLGGGSLFLRAKGAGGSLYAPGRRIVSGRQALKKISDVGVSGWVVSRNRVIHIPRKLSPRIEYDLFVGMVGMDGGDGTPDRIVAEDRTDAHFNAELKLMPRGRKLAEEWFVLAHRLPLLLKMVQPLPTQRGLTTGPPLATGPGSA